MVKHIYRLVGFVAYLVQFGSSTNYFRTASSTSSATFTNPTVSYACNSYPCGVLNQYTCYQTCYYSYNDVHTITATSGHRVVLVIQYLGGGTDDYIKANEGSSGGTQLLYQTGNSAYTGLVVTSSSNIMAFTFVNNGDGDIAIYKARYFSFDPEGNPDPSQTIFASETPTYTSFYPNTFPSTYVANTDLWWILKAPCQSYKLTGSLFFSDFHNCNDQLKLRDGKFSSSTILKQYCSRLTADPDTATFTSTQQYIYVEMDMGSGGAYYGFAISYYWVENTAFTYTTPISTCSSSGVSITAYCPFTDLVLQSPNYGSTYDSNSQCEYIISGDDDGYRVKLEFTNFDVENSTYCVYDSLKIYDGNAATESLQLNTFCGVDIPPIIYSASQYLRLVFKTDYTLQYLGFKISYSSINSTYPVCYNDYSAGKLTATSAAQYITSQNYPNDYTNNLDEYWWVYNPNQGSNNLVIEILAIDIEKAPNCKFDKIMIYSGPCTTYPVVETYCDIKKKRYEFSSSADYLIRFHTDRNIVHGGFRLKYLYETVQSTSTTTVPTTTNGPQYSRVVEMMHELVYNFTQSRYNSENLAMKSLEVASPSTLDFYLTRLYDIDVENGLFKVAGFFSIQWLDEFIVWDPDKKDNVTKMYMFQEDVWKPDLVHANSANASSELGYNSEYLVVTYNGTVTWTPLTVLTSSCKFDMSYFPYDEHTCDIKMRTWSVTTTSLAMVQGSDKFQVHSLWSEPVEWSLVSTSSSIATEQDAANGNTYSTFTYTITIKRNAKFQIYLNLAPYIIIGGLNILGFIIPIQAKGKARFSISSFLLIFIHLIITIKHLPESSEYISVFGIYFLCVACFSSALVCISMYLMRVSRRNIDRYKVGPKLKSFTVGVMFLREKALCGFIKVIKPTQWEPTWVEAVGAVEFLLFWVFSLMYIIFTIVMMVKLFS